MTGVVLARIATLRRRRSWVLLHRWVGLVIGGFLVIAAVSGSLLAFYEDLDTAINPGLYRVSPPGPDAEPLDPLVLRERAEQLAPSAWVHFMPLYLEHGADRAVLVYLGGQLDPVTLEEREPPDDELFLDPYTGKELGRRSWGDITEGKKNLMPFIYRLHYTLALETPGAYVLGIVALLWTLDCFVGFGLTLPRTRPFWQRWRPAWGVKRARLNFDLHRAGGLWLWAMLFVFAWSGVAFNLVEVYRPVTSALLGMNDTTGRAAPAQFRPQPGLNWHDARRIGREFAARSATENDITLLREDYLEYHAEHGEFTYEATTRHNNNGLPDEWLVVSFDGDTGALRHVRVPSPEQAGDFVTRWLLDMHMARVWGLPFRIFVCALGFAVALLTITGVVVWWRRRRVREAGRERRARRVGERVFQ